MWWLFSEWQFLKRLYLFTWCWLWRHHHHHHLIKVYIFSQPFDSFVLRCITLGLAFLPLSVALFISQNFFGNAAFLVGRWVGTNSILKENDTNYFLINSWLCGTIGLCLAAVSFTIVRNLLSEGSLRRLRNNGLLSLNNQAMILCWQGDTYMTWGSCVRSGISRMQGTLSRGERKIL